MASSPPNANTNRPTSAASQRNELYNLCAETPDKIYNQKDLEDFNVTSSPEELVKLCQDLVHLHLFQMFMQEGVVCWRPRDRSDAKRIAQLNPHETLVYTTIEGTQLQGIWTRTLKNRTNLHQSVLTKCLKSLESQKLIKSVKNAKFPGRKIFMLYSLNPGDDVTGGPWFSEGELDSSFVELIAELVVDWVRAKSWRMGEKIKVPGVVAPADRAKKAQRKDKPSKKGASATPAPADGETNATPGPAGTLGAATTANGSKDKSSTSTVTSTGAKRKRASNTEPHHTPPPDIESTPPPPSSLAPPTDPETYHPIGIDPHTHRQLLPHPPGYAEYPSASDILTWIEATGIVSSKNLTLADLNTLLDVLVFDGKLERVGKRRVGAGFGGRGETDETGDDGADEDTPELEPKPEPVTAAAAVAISQTPGKAAQPKPKQPAIKPEDTEPPSKKKRKVRASDMPNVEEEAEGDHTDHHAADANALGSEDNTDNDNDDEDNIRAPPRRRNRQPSKRTATTTTTTTTRAKSRPSAEEDIDTTMDVDSDEGPSISLASSDSSTGASDSDSNADTDEDEERPATTTTEPLYRASLLQPPAPAPSSPTYAFPRQQHADSAADELAALGIPAVPPVWGGNGFSETPCARCSAFGVCEEGGPVDAGRCAYWGPWLRGVAGMAG